MGAEWVGYDVAGYTKDGVTYPSLDMVSSVSPYSSSEITEELVPKEGTVSYLSVINTETNNVDIYSTNDYKPITKSIAFDPVFYNNYFSTLLKHEGGRSDRKSDKGGKTMMGITHKVYKSYSKMLLVNDPISLRLKLIQPGEVLAISQQYWKASGQNISDLQLAFMAFDTHFNDGLREVTNTTLEMFGIQKQNSTSAALGKLNNLLKTIDAKHVFNVFLSSIECMYWRIVEDDEKKNGEKANQRENISGWLTRTHSFKYQQKK